jgi:putative ABC transport system substrate-binding protein
VRRWCAVFLAALAALAPFAVEAQPQAKVYRIGVLTPGFPPPGLLEAFRDGLRDLGYVEGKSVAIEWRFAEGRNERLAGLAEGLVQLKVDVIFAVNTPAAQAAKKATGSIPIVIARLADPVGTGLVSSVSRPGGNITGLSSITDEVAVKRLEFLMEIFPGLSRVAAIWNAGNPGARNVVKVIEHAIPSLGLELQLIPVRAPSDFDGAFEAAAARRAQALFVVDDVLVTTHKARFLDLAAKYSIPVVASYREFAEAGALMTFGTSVPYEYRRAADFVDRILKGAKPADLPIEQPTKLLYVINLRTARALGLTIPPALLLRADEVFR